MKKFICTVCGYIHEGDAAPEKCPLCKAPASKFNEMVETEGGLEFADQHVIGVAKGCDEEIMKKFICTVCGYIHEGDAAPEKCPLCKAPASKFNEMVETEGGLEFADQHVIGVAKGCDEEMIKDLNNHFMGECTEVGMYLAMSRQADREGYPEVAEAFKRYAWEEAEHAAKFAELLGDCVWDTKTNLEKRMNAESGACADKKRIATRAKALNLDAIHDTVHEMAKDEARHGKGFEGLYNRYFKK